MLFGDVNEEYMANVHRTVEALIAIEGPAAASRSKEDALIVNVV